MTCGRRRVSLRLVSISLASAFFCIAAPARATIRYRISLAHPEAHRFRVAMTIPAAAQGVTVAMPAWNAVYEIRDFAYRIHDMKFAAADEAGTSGPQLFPQPMDKQTWRLRGSSVAAVAPPPRAFQVSYSIEWNDPPPFSSQLNERHAFLNLAQVLLYVPNRRAEPVEVQFEDLPAGWKLMAELPAGPDSSSFTASSYDTLVDAPVEAGSFDEFEFDSGGARFRVSVDSKSFNRARLEEYLQRITAYEIKLMGGPPFKEYTFILHFGPRPEAGGGGMEHANSAAISASSVDAPDLFAHEFFHAWNVKRIRPQTFEPVDYTKEQYTRALWFAEGVTSTYAAYALVRSGLWSKNQFYDDLAQQITELESRPAHQWQSAEESSLDTWLDKYDEYNLPDRSISYYNKGQILGVLLDLAVREATNNRKSLDDVMRRMNDEYAKQGKFYEDSNGVRAAVEEVSGVAFEDFFRRYVAGVEELPFQKLFDAAGLQLETESAKTADLGFTPGRGDATGVPVAEVEPESPAESAGLRAGDVIVKRNGQDIPRGRRGWLQNIRPGDSITLQILREGRPLTISYVFAASSQNSYFIAEIPKPTEKQLRIRQGLLRGTTNE